MKKLTVQLKRPLFQAIYSFLLALLFMLIIKSGEWTGWFESSLRAPWIVASAFVLFFIGMCSIGLQFAKSMMEYWKEALLSYIGLAVLCAWSARIFSGLKISEAGAYRWIFMVLLMAFFVFMAISFFARKIVEMAENEDWDPKKRK